jgi:hypothetical protein
MLSSVFTPFWKRGPRKEVSLLSEERRFPEQFPAHVRERDEAMQRIHKLPAEERGKALMKFLGPMTKEDLIEQQAYSEAQLRKLLAD